MEIAEGLTTEGAEQAEINQGILCYLRYLCGDEPLLSPISALLCLPKKPHQLSCPRATL
jgi:hypothetical protein